MRETHRHALLAGVIVLIGALIARLGLGDVAVFGIDDANITHTYARNIAAGYGPVFYPGGERVEGSTSTLWTLITAAIWAVAGQAPLAFLALSAVVTWLSAYLTFRLWALVHDTLKLNAALVQHAAGKHRLVEPAQVGVGNFRFEGRVELAAFAENGKMLDLVRQCDRFAWHARLPSLETR